MRFCIPFHLHTSQLIFDSLHPLTEPISQSSTPSISVPTNRNPLTLMVRSLRHNDTQNPILQIRLHGLLIHQRRKRKGPMELPHRSLRHPILRRGVLLLLVMLRYLTTLIRAPGRFSRIVFNGGFVASAGRFSQFARHAPLGCLCAVGGVVALDAAFDD